MSINSSSPYVWPQPFQWPSNVGATGDSPATPAAHTGTTTQGNANTPSSGQTTPGTGTSTLFQQLVADIQAVLVEGQGTSTSPANSTTGTSTSDTTVPASLGGETTATDPADQLATDIQSIYSQIQANQANAETTTQTMTTGQLDPTSQAQTHHHHHHGGGAQASETSSVGTSATTGTSSTTASTSTADSGNSVPSSIQTASQALAADILQALQSYGSSSSSTETPGVTA
jgi:hypothetical protein